MTEFEPHQFEKLKAELLVLSGIKQIIPSDCKRLSANIYHKTHLQVSETTLKRVFGFACSEFKPSAFTVSAIAQYCGYTGWHNFVDTLDHDATPTHQCSTWDRLSVHAKKITGFTLQTLRNRSGIPFDQTIPRATVDQHIQIFATEPYTATVLSAPAGHGKTMALCHWAMQHGKTHPQDIVLYYKFSNVPGTTKVNDLNAFLLAMLGSNIEGNIFEAGFFADLTPKGKFYLIVDGLNDAGPKRNDLQSIFAQLADVISLYQKYPWFKVILSMRSSTWAEYRQQVVANNRAWFFGFMTDQRQGINLPVFDTQELLQLAGRINPLNLSPLKGDHLSALSHPLYFQYYYQARQHNLSLADVNAITVYQTTTAYVVQHVYRGRYNDDKVILLRSLVSHLTEVNGAFRVNKLHVNTLIKNHEPAFRELMSTGIIRHADTGEGPTYQSYLEFSDNNLLHFAMAEKLIADNNGRFDQQLIQMINADACVKANELQVLKWCIYNMATTVGLHQVKWLMDAGLNMSDQAALLLLLGQLMQSTEGSAISRTARGTLNITPDNSELFNYIVGAQFMDRDHELSLIALSDLCDDEEQKLLIKLYLSIIAIIKLDLSKLEQYLDQLRAVPAARYHCLPVNPVQCLDSIYFYLKFGIIKKEPLADITRFCFEPAVPAGCSGNVNIESIIPMLAICTAMIYQNQRKTVRFINALQKVYPPASAAQNFMLQCWLACAYVNIDTEKASAIYDQLTQAFKQNEVGFTPFMRLSYYVLKLRMAVLQRRTDQIMTDLRSLTRLCDTEDHKLIKVSAIAYLLNSGAMAQDQKLSDQLHYDLVRTTRSTACRADSFYLKPEPIPVDKAPGKADQR